jgi:hypothetical protein
VQGALEWLETNQDKSLEEIKAEQDDEEGPALQPGEEARSLVCNECGKKFRSQAQAEFHASKSQHVDFSESTEEIAPLTEEQKKERLEELRQKLAAKRAGQSEQDKVDKKRNEVREFVSGRIRANIRPLGDSEKEHQGEPGRQRGAAAETDDERGCGKEAGEDRRSGGEEEDQSKD